MIILYADKNKLTVRKRETITSGSVNVYQCRFEFSEDWADMTKTACFRSGSQAVSVLLDASGECVIPREVTDPDDSGKRLYAGVCGVQDGGAVLPTVWADLGEILKGVRCCTGTRLPTPGLHEQVLSQLESKQDKLQGRPGQVVGFDESGGAVPVDVPSGCEFGHGLKQTGNRVSVDAVDDFTGDNTLPMTAAGVQAVVGNIDALLSAI